ncbi:MAG: glutamine amidotransferase WbuY [Bacteroidota bacterium]|jgi:glutamine amidotransferase
MIVIIDYNVGNVGSILNMLKSLKQEAEVTRDRDKILNADKLILPGVGSFDNGMKNLKNLGLIEILNEAVITRKKPILGICLGMQLMAARSDEGIEDGLRWIDLSINSFKIHKEYTGTYPVMGWNYIQVCKENILVGDEKARFYFVHSYFLPLNDFCILKTEINNFEYCAGFQKENIFGVQFHPEKSNKYGMRLLTKFCEL